MELRECNNPNNDIDEFFRKIDVSFRDAQGNITGNFRTVLQNAGYDIVYIDNKQGTDDIVRNAHLFEAVVRWVNAGKVNGTGAGAEKNVVMGQSMGGLVSRYGLAEMAKRPNNSDDPHTRLLILHDSPQRGANNPAGVQSLTRSFDVPFLFGKTLGQLVDKIGATVRVLDQPASQQLSILNAFNGRGAIRANTFIPNIYQPMITFSGPAPYDVVAVSNGSQCGRGQNINPGQAISVSSLQFLLPVPFFNIPYVGAQAGVVGAFGAYALPAYGTTSTISYVDLRLAFNVTIGKCPVCVSIPLRFTLLRESATSPANTLPLETLPGGSTNPRQQAGSCADNIDFGSLNGIYSAYIRTNLYNGDLCFVPSYSGLDVPTVTPTTAFAKYINNTTDNPSLPNVRRYVAQENVNNAGTQFNVAHISFTPRNSEWIFNEMQGLTPCPPAINECDLTQTARLTGPDFTCPGSAATFVVTGVPAGYTVTWSNTLGGVPATATGASYTFTVPGSRTTNGQVTATLSTPCTSRALTAPVVVVPVLRVSQIPDSRCGMVAQANIAGFNNVIWIINGQERLSPIAEDGIREFWEFQSGQVTVALKGTNVCTGAVLTSATVSKTGPATGNRVCPPQRPAPTAALYLYPNPAHATVDVHVENATPAAPVTVRLFDAYGRPRAEQTSTGPETVRLKTDQLPAGLYFVHLLRGTEVLSRQQLRIEK